MGRPGFLCLLMTAVSRSSDLLFVAQILAGKANQWSASAELDGSQKASPKLFGLQLDSGRVIVGFPAMFGYAASPRTGSILGSERGLHLPCRNFALHDLHAASLHGRRVGASRQAS